MKVARWRSWDLLDTKSVCPAASRGMGSVKSAEEIMNMLEAFDLTGSLRDAGELAGCSHHTVAGYVAAREAGALSARPAPRVQLIDSYVDKVEEWVERSKGRIRADVAPDKLVALAIPVRSARRGGRWRR